MTQTRSSSGDTTPGPGDDPASFAAPGPPASLLRPIPEDRSATSGRRTHKGGEEEAASEAATSTRALRNGHGVDESVLSDASAILAGAPLGEGEAQQRGVGARRPSRRESLRVFATSRRALILVGCMLLIAAVATIAAVFASRSDGNDSQNDEEILVEVTEPPTPTASPIVDHSLDLDSILIELSNPDDLFEHRSHDGQEQSASYQARQWMLTEDELLLENLMLAEETGNEDPVVQRYTLAVLYFACHGDFWNQTSTPGSVAYLDPTASECTWEGVGCGDRDVVHALNLANANVTCETSLPPELQYLTGMRELLLNQNQIAGSLLLGNDEEPQEEESESPTSWLGFMPLLSYLDLSLNFLTGPIPDDLWTRVPLHFVYLNDNFFNGSLPVERPRHEEDGDIATTLTFLEDFWVSNNQLTGPAPAWMLQDLAAVQSLRLDFNGFTGTLPTRMAAVNVTYVDFSNNFVSGPLVADFLNAATLEFLYLENNTLTGKLPLGNLPSPLQHVWLNDNQFQGRIPDRFAFAWSRLEELRLQDNALTGSLDAQCENATWAARLDPPVEVVADCSNEVGGTAEVTCSCCECSGPVN